MNMIVSFLAKDVVQQKSEGWKYSSMYGGCYIR